MNRNRILRKDEARFDRHRVTVVQGDTHGTCICGKVIKTEYRNQLLDASEAHHERNKRKS